MLCSCMGKSEKPQPKCSSHACCCMPCGQQDNNLCILRTKAFDNELERSTIPQRKNKNWVFKPHSWKRPKWVAVVVFVVVVVNAMHAGPQPWQLNVSFRKWMALVEEYRGHVNFPYACTVLPSFKQTVDACYWRFLFFDNFKHLPACGKKVRVNFPSSFFTSIKSIWLRRRCRNVYTCGSCAKIRHKELVVNWL